MVEGESVFAEEGGSRPQAELEKGEHIFFPYFYSHHWKKI